MMQLLDEVSQEPGISPKLMALAKILSCKLLEDRAWSRGPDICSDDGGLTPVGRPTGPFPYQPGSVEVGCLNRMRDVVSVTVSR